MATYDDFQKIDIRVGKIIEVEDFPEAHKPLYKIRADFGKEIGIKQSAVGATHNYTKKELKGKLILGLVNMSPKQIGPFSSEFLTLGVSDNKDHCVLISPDEDAPLGGKVF